MARSGKKRDSPAFSATPATGGQIEKWPPVVRSRGKVQILGFEPSYGPLWFFPAKNQQKREVFEISK
jgi:hypothetical protein